MSRVWSWHVDEEAAMFFAEALMLQVRSRTHDPEEWIRPLAGMVDIVQRRRAVMSKTNDVLDKEMRKELTPETWRWVRDLTVSLLQRMSDEPQEFAGDDWDEVRDELQDLHEYIRHTPFELGAVKMTPKLKRTTSCRGPRVCARCKGVRWGSF